MGYGVIALQRSIISTTAHELDKYLIAYAYFPITRIWCIGALVLQPFPFLSFPEELTCCVISSNHKYALLTVII